MLVTRLFERFYRCGQDWLGPLRDCRQVYFLYDPASFHVKLEHGVWRDSSSWVGFRAVVIEQQFREPREKPNEVEAALLVTFADLVLGNIVAAAGNTRMDTRKVKLGTGKTYKPHTDIHSSQTRLFQQIRDRVAAQSCFENEVSLLFNGLFQQSTALMPRCTISFSFGHCRTYSQEALGSFVRIEVFATFCPQCRAGDATFTGAIGASQNRDLRVPLSFSHVLLPLLPQLCQDRPGWH